MFESFLGVNVWTALFVLANTLTIFFVAKKFLFGPVTKLIEDRQQEIDGMYSDAGTARENARELEETYRKKLSAASETGENIVKAAVARGQERQEAILRQASAEAAAMLDRAAANIALEKKKAVHAAKDEISGIALSIAEKVVGRALNGPDQQRLIDAFINELGETE